MARLVGLVAGTLLGLILIAIPAAAEPNDPIDVPSESYFDFLLDETNGLIFISEGVGPHVFAYDLTGELAGVIEPLPKASGMALSVDGTQLWVALPRRHAVAAIDIATLTEVDRIFVPDDVCPGHLTHTGSKLAMAYSCRDWGITNDAAGIGVIDLANGNAWQSIDYSTSFTSRPEINGSPGLGDIVLFSQDRHDPIDVYDVSSGTPVLVIDDTPAAGGGVSITPDGTRLLSFAPLKNLGVYGLPDVVREDVYGPFEDLELAAWSADAGHIILGRDNDWVDVFDVDTETVVATYRAQSRQNILAVAATAEAADVVFLTFDRTAEQPLGLHIRRASEETCFGEPATLIGTEGVDFLDATPARDVIVTLGGDDVIFHLGPGDLLCSGPGDDHFFDPDSTTRIKGGSGRDTASYASSSVNSGVNIDLNAEWYPGAPFPELISIENIVGSRYADILIGDDLRNVISGNGGEDLIEGRGGNDTLVGSLHRDVLKGGLGNDKLRGAGGDDRLFGGKGDDVLRGGGGLDLLIGGLGNDVLEGEGDNDELDGGYGDDELFGGGGNDLLLGSAGADVLKGSSGNDTLAGEAGRDTLVGGAGTDTASFAFAPAGVYVSLTLGTARGEGRDTLATLEWIVGSQRTDHLIGDDGPNLIEARGGDDSVEGLGGNDYLHSGDGTDTILAGTGTDVCIGGEVTDSCETNQPADAVEQAPPDEAASRFEWKWGIR